MHDTVLFIGPIWERYSQNSLSSKSHFPSHQPNFSQTWYLQSIIKVSQIGKEMRNIVLNRFLLKVHLMVAGNPILKKLDESSGQPFPSSNVDVRVDAIAVTYLCDKICSLKTCGIRTFHFYDTSLQV